jgi:DNA repair photolyase
MRTSSIPIPLIKGRGSATRHPHRFESDARDAWLEPITEHDDPWCLPPDARPITQVSTENARSVISRNDSPDIGFEQSLNPYRGCEHGCSYCYARPSHSYLNLSPGLDFETRLVAKVNVAQRLREEFARPGYVPRMIAIGTVTDAYQPIEREWRLTRQVLEVMQETHHPCALVTKGSGVLRDLDLLSALAREGLVAVLVTLTTLDVELSRRLEPRAAAPHRRLQMIRALHQAGIPVGVSVAPQIPFLNVDMEACLTAAREAGASRAFYSILRLPWELSPLFRQWLELHYPQRAERVMSCLQAMRGGKDYDARFGVRGRGTGQWADLYQQRFERACRRLGFNRDRWHLCTDAFRAPSLDGQASLF